MCVLNVASYDNYMLINSYLAFCCLFLLFAFFYDNLIAIRCNSGRRAVTTQDRGIEYLVYQIALAVQVTFDP